MNDLPTCPACGAPHLPVATRCPKCGEPFRQDQLEKPPYEPKRPGRLVVIAAVVVAAAAGIWAVAPSLRRAATPEPRAATPPAAERTADRPTAGDPVGADSPPPAAAEIRAAPPPAAEPPAPTVQAPPTAVRWTADWANVRVAPSLSADVVTIVRPGTRVEVAEPRAGFWRLYRDGTAVGWIAGSLLRTEAP